MMGLWQSIKSKFSHKSKQEGASAAPVQAVVSAPAASTTPTEPTKIFGLRRGGDVTGVHGQGVEIRATYDQLQAILGPAMNSGDGYKTSTEWELQHGGSPVTIYDWKATNYYSDNLPNVSDFRAKGVHEWHVAAKTREKASMVGRLLEAEIADSAPAKHRGGMSEGKAPGKKRKTYVALSKRRSKKSGKRKNKHRK